MKFVVDLTLAVEADDIAAAFRAAIQGKGRVEAAGIRPQMFPGLDQGPDIDAPQPEPVKVADPEPKAEEKPKPAAKKKAAAKKKTAAKKAPAKKAEPAPKPEPEPEPQEGELTISKEQLVDTARLYMSKFGAQRTRELLKRFDAQQLREVDEARWGEVFEAMREDLGDE